MSANPTALQLRYLQTLLELGSSQASTIVFPLPIDLLKPLLEATKLDGTERRPPPVPAGVDNGEAADLALGTGSARAQPADEPRVIAEQATGDMEAVEAQVERARAHHERTEADLPE
jgi:hypothetical protein